MAVSKVAIGEMDVVLKTELTLYGSKAQDALQKAAEEIGGQYRQILIDTSPVGSESTIRKTGQKRKRKPTAQKRKHGRYRRGWTQSVVKPDRLTFTVSVHNKTDWQLTHLLERGHKTRGGTYTRAIRHVEKAKAAAEAEYEALAKKELEAVDSG